MSEQYGIIILKPGYTLNNIEDPRAWAFNSRYPMLKVATKGAGTLDGSPAQEIINHDLGYNPLNLLYVEDVINPGQFHLATGDTATGFPFVRNNPGDPNNIYVIDEFASDQDFFYFVFYDETLT